jgi:RNA-binding protein YhbY
MKATLKIGKKRLSPQFLNPLDEVLNHQQLVKVKFDEFKEQKKELTPKLPDTQKGSPSRGRLPLQSRRNPPELSLGRG